VEDIAVNQQLLESYEQQQFQPVISELWVSIWIPTLVGISGWGQWGGNYVPDNWFPLRRLLMKTIWRKSLKWIRSTRQNQTVQTGRKCLI